MYLYNFCLYHYKKIKSKFKIKLFSDINANPSGVSRFSKNIELTKLLQKVSVNEG